MDICSCSYIVPCNFRGLVQNRLQLWRLWAGGSVCKNKGLRSKRQHENLVILIPGKFFCGISYQEAADTVEPNNQ